MEALRGALTGLAALALLAGTLLVGACPAPPGAAVPADAVSGLAAGTRTVTLPTGDRLDVRTGPAGRPLVAPASSTTPLLTRTIGGDLYAVPLSALRAQGAGMDVSRYDVSALLRGEDTAPTTARPHFPMRTVTVAVTDDQGRPATGVTVQIMNVDDRAKYQTDVTVVDGLAKISVPDGHYAAMLPDVTFDADGDPATVKLAFGDFTVAGGPTSTAVDLRTATHLVGVGTPQPADLVGQDIAWYRGVSDTDGAEWSLNLPASTKVYLGDSPATAGVQHFYVHDRFESPAESPDPYVYDLEFPTDGALTGDQHHDADPAELATLDTRYHADVAGTDRTLLYGALPWEPYEFRTFHPVAVPQRRTEYVTTSPGLTYYGVLTTSQDIRTGENMTGGVHAYRAGQRGTVDWMQGPIVPGLPADTGTGFYLCGACREDDTLSLLVGMITDSQPDHSGYPVGDTAAGARFQLFQGATKLADFTGYTGGDFTVPPGAADYRAVYDLTRAMPTTTLSTSSHTEWTFRSQHSGTSTVPDRWYCGDQYRQTDCSPLSLVTLNYQLPQTLNGTVGTGPQALTLNVGHSAGAPAVPIKQTTVAISYDHGAHWAQVPVVPGGHGRYIALWTNSSGTAGTTVSLKVTAADTTGATTSQTVTDAVAIAS